MCADSGTHAGKAQAEPANLVCVWASMPQHTWRSEDNLEVLVHLPPSGSRGANSGHRVFLPTEPSHPTVSSSDDVFGLTR